MPSPTDSAPSWSSTRGFLDLHPVDDDARRWVLHLSARNTGGGGSLFGGAGLAAGLECLAAHTGRPAVWGTAQFSALTREPVTIELEVDVTAAGRKSSQGRVTGRVEGSEVFTVLGAVGSRPDLGRGLGATMPAAPAPEDCELLVRDEPADALHAWVEVRMARGLFGFTAAGEPSGDERTLLWTRLGGCPTDPAALAVLADYMPAALGNAYGRETHCSSLDNTLRLCDPAPGGDDGWVLLENRMEYAARGFAVGSCLMWSREGTLLATASQSMAVSGFADD